MSLSFTKLRDYFRLKEDDSELDAQIEVDIFRRFSYEEDFGSFPLRERGLPIRALPPRISVTGSFVDTRCIQNTIQSLLFHLSGSSGWFSSKSILLKFNVVALKIMCTMMLYERKFPESVQVEI